jgi:XTP/dITP diphosphohydrolase
VTVVKEEEVKQNWEKLKVKRRKNISTGGRFQPALVKASRIQDKEVGFDWEEPHQVWEKVQEELEGS